MNEKYMNYKIMDYGTNDSYNKHTYWVLTLQGVTEKHFNATNLQNYVMTPQSALSHVLHSLENTPMISLIWKLKFKRL
jgi:hypothetical protein